MISFASLIDRTGLGCLTIANRQPAVETEALAELLPDAVEAAREHFVERRKVFEASINTVLEEEIRALDAFRDRQIRQLEFDFAQCDQAAATKRARKARTRRDIEDVHDEYLSWMEETMTTEPHPWIKVICAMTPVPGSPLAAASLADDYPEPARVR